jgi:O-acetyl-ADP-ribose deacetylase (regulator of RNase III)
LAKADYLSLKTYELGETQFSLNNKVIVANMIAQNGFISSDNPQPCSLASLSWCLLSVFELAQTLVLPVYMPRIGAGLGGAKWEDVEDVINDTLNALIDDVDVTIFTLPQEVNKFPKVSYE